MKPVILYENNHRTSVTRWGAEIKTRSDKGTPRTPHRRIQQRIAPDGKLRDWHPTKGFRGLPKEVR